MVMRAENWVGEYTPTVGGGDITLGGPIDGFCGFANAGDNVDVYYTIMDGANKETGIGTVVSGNLIRKTIHAVLLDGSYTKGGSPLQLSGDAQVYLTANASFMDHIQKLDADLAQTIAQVTMLSQVTINGYPVSGDISLNASDVHARPDSWTPNANDVGSYSKSESDQRYVAADNIETSEQPGKIMIVGGPRDKQITADIQNVSVVPVNDLRNEVAGSIREAIRRSYQEAGYNLVDGSFELGGVLHSTSDVLLHQLSGKAYSWDGAYPVNGYVVAPGTDPTAVGSGYVPRTDILLRDELAADSGANLVFSRLASALSAAFSIKDYVDQSPIYPDLQFGADNTGVSDATSKLQAIIDAYPSATIVINGTYLFSRLNLQGFKGVINGSGTLKATGTQDIGLYFGDANGVVFDGPWLDMSHTPTTTTETRCRYGFYLRNARNCRITPKVKNVRRGYPYWIDGTSSAAGAGKLDSWGSKDIYIVNPRILAFSDDPDQGAQCVVKSDYYAGDGVTYVSGGNGVKASDFTVESSVSYPATTERVFLLGGYYENCDRIGVLNAKHVYETNSILNGMGKRGFNISPTCNNVHLHGGSVRGGISAVINFTLGCTQCSAGGKFIDPQGYDSLSGEATALRVFQGCRDIAFYDIRGKGGALRSIWIVGSSDVTVDNVKLDANTQSATENCIEINAGLGGNTNSWVMSGIRIRNSQFAGKYGYAQNMTTGSATYSDDAIRLRNVIFTESTSASRTAFLTNPAVQDTFSVVNCEFATAVSTILSIITHAKANKNNTFAGEYLASSFVENRITTDTLPDSCPVGVTQSVINGTNSAPGTNKQGILETIKTTQNTGFRKFIVQRYYPANHAGTEYKTVYIRRGLKDSNDWSAWANVTGT